MTKEKALKVLKKFWSDDIVKPTGEDTSDHWSDKITGYVWHNVSDNFLTPERRLQLAEMSSAFPREYFPEIPEWVKDAVWSFDWLGSIQQPPPQ